ncbi:MAG: hypothetical protein A2Z40_04260 [Deltaproteobacteria bacterium RBG_19FT_COMBO_60_16]|nr:MAG: hypothetical protein A2Z40_04260 [Deltaproteobacteria bacterium RBG_19FT_COMBO_60_16]
MEFHPACLKLPPLSKEEYGALRESIRQGWDSRHPILLHEKKVLDGRHRYLACVEESVTPTFVEWTGGNPFALVRREHEARRNWTSDAQKHHVLKQLLSLESEWKRNAEEIQAAANLARSEKAKERPRKPDGTLASGSTNGATTGRKGHEKGARAKAASTGVNRGAVQVAEKIEKLSGELDRQDLLEGFANGEIKANSALKQLEEEKRKRDLESPVRIKLPEGMIHGDFRKLSKQIPDNSVELVFTDPPYNAKSIPLYGEAAEISARILKPGGSFIAYSGQRHLREVLNVCSEHLVYWWTIACIHSGGNQMLQKLGIRAGWKPIIWFVKGTRGDIQNVLTDTVTGDREKHAHEWQQAEAEAIYIIEKLTSKNGIIVDFFLGGGTSAVAAKKLGRKWIGYEVNAVAISKAARRLNDCR